uniref:Phospholipase B-like n=1 Tax=Oncorhynchus kisutch TaxID=8019 RepID=A0A8C7DP01_ONCKI
EPDFQFPTLTCNIACFTELKAAAVYWDATHKTVQLKEGVIEKEGDLPHYTNCQNQRTHIISFVAEHCVPEEDSTMTDRQLSQWRKTTDYTPAEPIQRSDLPESTYFLIHQYRNRYCENTLYTGFLVSLDDFYLLGSGLMMTQTTNNVFNTSLFSQVPPHSLSLGSFPMHLFTHFFTLPLSLCTYNNQYMIGDMRKVTLGHSIEDEDLTVVEQILGLVEFSDQTRALRRGYWSSYNVPFHPKIYTLSGYGKMCEEYGEDFSYDLCPWAKIFPQTHHEIQHYKNDPYSKGRSICCRNDLREKDPSPGGSEAVNGPTMQGDLPPFSWEDFNSTAQQGLPDHYDFPFISMHPALFMP